MKGDMIDIWVKLYLKKKSSIKIFENESLSFSKSRIFISKIYPLQITIHQYYLLLRES